MKTLNAGWTVRDRRRRFWTRCLPRRHLIMQAKKDSIVVTDDEVEAVIDQRLRYFIAQYGSKEALEQISGSIHFSVKRSIFRQPIRETKTRRRNEEQGGGRNQDHANRGQGISSKKFPKINCWSMNPNSKAGTNHCLSKSQQGHRILVIDELQWFQTPGRSRPEKI